MHASIDARPAQARERGLEALLVAACIGWLFAVLGDVFPSTLGRPLNPDLTEWVATARCITSPYDTFAREPLYAIYLRGVLDVVTGEERALRIATVVATLLSALTLYAAARALLGRGAALVVLALFCINPVVVYYAFSGMREPLQVALQALFTATLVVAHQRRPAMLGCVAGVVGGLLCLTRIYCLLFVLGGAALVVIDRAWAYRRVSRATAIFVGALLVTATAIVLPRLLVPAGYVGENIAFFHSLQKMGAPYLLHGEPRPTLVDFLFWQRGSLDVLVLLGSNVVRAFTEYLPYFFRGYAALWWVAAIGGVLSVVRGHGVLLGLFLAALAPVVPVLHLDQVPGAVGVENRLLLPMFPFALLLLVDVPRRIALALQLPARVGAWLEPHDVVTARAAASSKTASPKEKARTRDAHGPNGARQTLD